MKKNNNWTFFEVTWGKKLYEYKNYMSRNYMNWNYMKCNYMSRNYMKCYWARIISLELVIFTKTYCVFFYNAIDNMLETI